MRVVDGGGTIAPIDDVRCITNHSTGRLSARITESCLRRGAEVWHIHAPAAELPYARSARFDLDAGDTRAEWGRLEALLVEYRRGRDRLHRVGIGAGTVADYSEALRRVLEENDIDVAFLAMAVSDFEPEPVGGKLSSGLRKLLISCRPTPKVIQSLKGWSPGTFLIGFKLLSNVPLGTSIEAARDACRVNHADWTVANDQATVSAGRHVIHLVSPDGTSESLGPDGDIAEALVGRVFERLAR
ncbi:MAG: phosphopantothenoylcysteine decarboxylase [Isosphaeraceae bacterium]